MSQFLNVLYDTSFYFVILCLIQFWDAKNIYGIQLNV